MTTDPKRRGLLTHEGTNLKDTFTVVYAMDGVPCVAKYSFNAQGQTGMPEIMTPAK